MTHQQLTIPFNIVLDDQSLRDWRPPKTVEALGFVWELPIARKNRIRPARMKRIGQWCALVVPSKRREEIAGDFLESIESMRQVGMWRVLLWIRIAETALVYAWIALRLRIGELAIPSEDTPESSD